METIKSPTRPLSFSHSCMETCTHTHIATEKAAFHDLCNKQVCASNVAKGMTDHKGWGSAHSHTSSVLGCVQGRSVVFFTLKTFRQLQLSWSTCMQHWRKVWWLNNVETIFQHLQRLNRSFYHPECNSCLFKLQQLVDYREIYGRFIGNYFVSQFFFNWLEYLLLFVNSISLVLNCWSDKTWYKVFNELYRPNY